ncbi:DUF4255 domain-containing protein [Cellulomonas sp. ICMP 17802]|uniref:DUF4255 domain-containing protein n=1 Tax=Cellulomonas sp. ICMP 17802 TaxID=3239199 RepID=UPI00351B5AC8
MSNTVAVAAVTSTICYILDQSLGGAQPGAVGGAKVTTLRPDQISASAVGNDPIRGLNVFLYEVTPNHAWNLTDLPTRRSDGSLNNRPVAAVDLHFLVSAYGQDVDLEPHRLMARAVLALSVNQVLTRDVVATAITHFEGTSGLEFLSNADLADQVELVKLAPQVLTLEELSRLWGAFGTSYLLSVAYTATVVVLEAEVSPRAAPPVLTRTVEVDPLRRPHLLGLDTVPPGAVVSTGSRLRLTGSGLRGPVTVVRVGGAELVPVAPLHDDVLEVVLTGDVPAGLLAASVVQRARPGPPLSPPPRTLARSNVLPVLVRPVVGATSATATVVSIGISPALRPGQRCEVDLARRTPLDGVANTVSVQLAPIAPGTPPSSTIQLDRADVPDGDWLVRVVVDGAQSMPTMSADVYDGPVLSLP